jgi:hypothetical protein
MASPVPLRGSRHLVPRACALDVDMECEPTYFTGEPICTGDLVRMGDWDGVVESVIRKDGPQWVDYIGEGVMLAGPAFGRLLTKFGDEDLVFVRRKQE